MEKNLVYTTCGTCSKLLDVTVENDRVKRVQFIGGCHGNSQGIAALIAGMEVDEAIARLSGNDCLRFRLRRQGHLLPRPVGEGADAVEKQPVAAENPPSVRRAAR